jgi:hypothetical protein
MGILVTLKTIVMDKEKELVKVRLTGHMMDANVYVHIGATCLNVEKLDAKG